MRVVFASDATNLVPGMAPGARHMFLRDFRSGETVILSMNKSGGGAGGIGTVGRGRCISDDGQQVVFSSGASDLVDGGNGGAEQVYLADVDLGTIEMVSVDANGLPGNGNSSMPSLSPDGRHVSFSSSADNLVTNDGNGTTDVFARDLVEQTTRRVSVSSEGTEGNADSDISSIANDGRVAFSSAADNLVPADTNARHDVFLHDPVTATTRRISVSVEGVQGVGDSFWPSVSADGAVVVFNSDAPNLVVNDMNGQVDVLLYEDGLAGLRTLSLARRRDPTGGGGFVWGGGALSSDGEWCVFGSNASDIVRWDRNQGNTDVFVVRARIPSPSTARAVPTASAK